VYVRASSARPTFTLPSCRLRMSSVPRRSRNPYVPDGLGERLAYVCSLGDEEVVVWARITHRDGIARVGEPEKSDRSVAGTGA
jgi:hypothetical protein